MTTSRRSLRFPPALAFSRGYEVVAMDGRVGHVERPIFRPGESEPSFIVLRLEGLHRRRRRVVPASFIDRVDDGSRRVRLGVRRRTVVRLPQRTLHTRTPAAA